MKKMIAASLAGAIACAAVPAVAAEQIVSFGGTLDYGSVWGTSPFGPTGANLGGKAYNVVMSYDPTAFASIGSCGAAPSTSCNFFFSAALPLTATFTVDGLSQSYTWTSGEFYLSSGGNDQFGFNFYGAAGSFSGSFGDGNSLYPDQASVNSPVFSDLTDLLLASGTFQFNSSGYGFGDAPSSLSASFTPSAPAVSSASVPEPTTWALMIVGFGMIGAGMRRRAKLGYALA